ncbi:MAG: CsgG/HfaB family protein [Spirochaetia bacterium]|nr:CsgG/HfaB family protein [Spirochaetia bacterium]
MKFLPALFLLLICACSSHVSIRKDYTVCKDATLAVADVFITESQKTEAIPQIGRAFANALAGHMLESGLNIVEREKLARLLSEMKLNQTGLIESSKISEIGHLVNADYILTGVGEVRFSGQSTFLANTTMRLVEVSTGQVVLVASWDGPSHSPVAVANLLGPEMGKSIAARVVPCKK